MIYSIQLAKKLVVYSVALAVLAACGGSDKQNNAVVPPKDTAPVAQGDSAVSLNDAVIEIDVLANDTAGSGGALTLTSVTTPMYGEASIVNNKIRYTPAATFLGSDSFSYTVTSGTLNATAAVAVSGHQSFSLNGRVIDSPIADATVTVTVNGETFSATADAQGFYDLPVLLTSAPDDALLRITAQGAEANAQGYVTLSSLTNSALQLLAMRQADQSITVEQLAAAQLTQLTTARDLLLKQLAQENSLTTALLTEIETSLDAEKMLQLAGAIKLLVDNPAFSLPEGYDTIEDFVLDESAFSTFIAQVSAGENSPLSQAMAATMADTNVMPELQPSLLQGRFIKVTDNASFFPIVSSEYIHITGSAIRVASSDNFELGPLASQSFPWVLDNNQLTIVDPEMLGHARITFFNSIGSVTSDPELIQAWNEAFNGASVERNRFSGFKRISIISQSETGFIANVERYERFEKIVFESGGKQYEIPERVEHYAFTSVFSKIDSVSKDEATFEIAENPQWIFPEFSGNINGSDLYTLHSDGTFDTLTEQYNAFDRTWQLSTDGRILTLEINKGSGQYHRMIMQHQRSLTTAYSALTSFTNEAQPDDTYVAIRPILPVKNNVDISEFSKLFTETNMLLSTISLRKASLWNGFNLKPASWYGWQLLPGDKALLLSGFRCDGELILFGQVCSGILTLPAVTQEWNWTLDGNSIKKIRKVGNEQGECGIAILCQIYGSVPLYKSAEGIYSGYEYFGIISTEGTIVYSAKPRIVHWLVQNLPSVE